MSRIDPLQKVEELGEDALHAVEELGDDVVRGFKRLTRLHMPRRKGDRPLKRSPTGYEAEMFVLDENGRVDQSGKLYRIAKKSDIPVAKEASKGMIEVLCLPHHHHRSTSLWLTRNLKNLLALARKHGYRLYPYGTYPGKQQPEPQKGKHYDIIKKMVGKRYKKTGLCAGYHQHYELPRGLFDHEKNRLKYTTTSKVRRTLLDSYNFLTAADPAVTTLMQSTPFVQGRMIAKDSRMLLQRCGAGIEYKYGKYPEEMYRFGELSQYEHTLKDLKHTLDQRRLYWKKLMKKKGLKPGKYTSPSRTLNFTWNPVKINAKGTLEYRGTDMNLMSNVFATSTMIKFALRRIQQDFMLVTPIDMKLKDAFKVEGNRVFIPPFTTVCHELQPLAAQEGLANEDVRTYTRRFYRFCRNEIKRFDPDYLPLLKPAWNTISSGKTESDRIIAKARRKGYKRKIPQAFARKLALDAADKFERDLEKAEKVLRKAHEYD